MVVGCPGPGGAVPPLQRRRVRGEREKTFVSKKQALSRLNQSIKIIIKKGIKKFGKAKKEATFAPAMRAMFLYSPALTNVL
jgi:hypothetical protein